MKDKTKAILSGRDPEAHQGAVNTPVYHASTILYPSLDAIRGRAPMEYTYGRAGTPTSRALETAIAEIEGGAGCLLTPSGASAVALAILSVVKSGDHILMVDSVYKPTRRFCDTFLRKMGVETEYYVPTIGADISTRLRDNTSLIFTESPGSQTFEVQDIPAICEIAKARNIKTAIDNTWASPLYFDPFSHGLDLSVQALTKYVVGHADALLGSVTANEENLKALKDTHAELGHCAGPDDIYLALRGLRTLPTRLAQHQNSALEIATWLNGLSFVDEVLYPALPGAAGHELWKRDFKGATGLFGVRLAPCSEDQLAAMLDNMRLFGMGYSWGGFESLIVPASVHRTAEPYEETGQLLRLHIGLEDVEDLKADLADGFARAGYETA